MIKNFLKTAFRNLLKNKTFSIINILGLMTGLACFLLIALYIFDELNFDRFHKNSDNIYRLVEDKIAPGGKETKIAGAGYQVSEKAKSGIPGIKEIVRLAAYGRANVSTTENTNVFYEDFLVGNPGFLTSFDFELLQGDRKTALTNPHSVVITAETANKLFNTHNVLGKAIKIDRDDIPFKVTGILKNFPANSHISFNLIFSESSMQDPEFTSFLSGDWSSGNFLTYFLLDKGADPHIIETTISQLVTSGRSSGDKTKSSFILQPLSDIHFYSAGIEGNDSNTANITYIYVFSLLALFVLIIACINYMNLTTARVAGRTKEIAVRKVAGATRRNLIGQFLSEAMLLTFVSLFLALVAVKIILPSFNSFTGKQLSLGIETDYRVWIGVFLTIMLTGLLAGIYPALFQSGLKPLSLLKNKFSTGKGTLSIRRSLVVFQFALSILMIIATIIVYRQVKYLNTTDMGFNKEQLVVVDINSGKVRRGAETIKTEFKKLSQVSQVSASSRVPGEWKDIPRVKVKNEQMMNHGGNDMYFLGVDDQFLQTYQVALLKGRNFTSNNPADSSVVLLNETAAREMGIQEPLEQTIEIPSVDFGGNISQMRQPYLARVAGIVKDFNFQSLREPVKPLIIGFQKNPVQSIDYFTTKISAADAALTLKKMDAILHSIDPNHLFEYHFLDKQWQLFYQQDQVRQTIFLSIAILTIMIACLGLFGLITFASQQRVKEIGIRKVLGASVSSIVSMLSRDFIRLVIVASCIAFPVAWWTMHNWLMDFAYRIELSWWIFILSGSIALFIALATISFQAIKAALRNPVNSLRTE